MRVTKVGETYKASRITGPKHNYLGMVVSLNIPEEMVVVARTLKEEEAVIDESRLVTAVQAGIEKANRAQERKLYAQSVEYVRSDTPDYQAYCDLASAIMAAAASDIGKGDRTR